ncbi:MAG: glucose-1-phosphate adenylyltransferase [Pseudomonadales bacterium]
MNTIKHHRLTERAYAVVLAGGRGSRLRELTDYRAKPAVPFAGNLKIIDFALSNCVNSGIRRIAVLTQYKAQSLIRHVERGWSFLSPVLGEYVDVVPAQQQQGERWYTGTANAVWQNQGLMREAGPDHVLILGGDHVYKMDYSVMLAEHVASGRPVSVACHAVPLEQASDFGIMSIEEDGRVAAFSEKPENPVPLPDCKTHALASMGVYVFDTQFLLQELALDAADVNSSHDFGKDIIPALVSRGLVQAHQFINSCVNMDGNNPYWRDVGTIDAYWEANMDLTKVVPMLNLYDDDWPILTRLPQLPPAKFVFDEKDRHGTASDSLVSSGCIISGATIKRSIIFPKVHVDEGSVIEDSIILADVTVGRNVALRKVIVEKHTRLPDGLRVGFDAKADRSRGFSVSRNGVTIVTPEALGQPIHVDAEGIVVARKTASPDLRHEHALAAEDAD